MTELEETKSLMIKFLSESENKRLIRRQIWEKLGYADSPEEVYYEAEQSLVDDRRIERRRGRNGGIYLIPDILPQENNNINLELYAATKSDKEVDHYQPILDQILAKWTEQPGYKHVFGSITARQGSKSTGGRWSRPDIVICTVSEWLFSSRPEGEVRTIEIKRFEVLDVMAVYEALSHKSRSHYSYLLIVNFPKSEESMSEDQRQDFDNILAVAGKNGIGVITASDSSDWSTWEFELYPTRSDADHQEINQLLLDQVEKEVREKFTEAIRNIQISVSF